MNRIEADPTISNETLLEEMRTMSDEDLMSIPITGRFSGLFETFSQMGRIASEAINQLSAPVKTVDVRSRSGKPEEHVCKEYQKLDQTCRATGFFVLEPPFHLRRNEKSPIFRDYNEASPNFHLPVDTKQNISGEIKWSQASSISLMPISKVA